MPSKLELVSIHIPKTAGTSFRNVLKRVYGRRRVIRIDIKLPSEQIPFNDKPAPPKRLPSRVRVIHGHFHFPMLASLYGIDKDVPVITWVRDPVDRVISNYFYLQGVLRKIVGKAKTNLNTLSRMEKTLEEFARVEANRNRMSKFLETVSLTNLFFVGIQEHFSEDLSDLAKMLGWGKVIEFRHNISQERKVPVSDDVKGLIGELNKKDLEIYQEALYLRELRQRTLRGKT